MNDAIAMLIGFQQRQHAGEVGAAALFAAVACAVGYFFLGRLMALFGPVVGLGVLVLAITTFRQYREARATLEKLRAQASQVRWIFPAKLDLVRKGTSTVVQTLESIEFHLDPRQAPITVRSGTAVKEFASMLGALRNTFPNAELGWSPEQKARYEAQR